jgi:hypothetical protein
MNIWNGFFEKHFVRSASHIVTVSEFVKYHISTLVNDKPFVIAFNGYDEEAYKEIDWIPESSVALKIAFAGSLYDWNPWKSVLSVFNKYLVRDSLINISITFYGVNKHSELASYLEGYPELNSRVCFVSKLSNYELIKQLSQHHLLLLFNYYSSTGTKIYDYLALKRPILFCYTHDKEALALKEKFYPFPPNSQLSDTLQENLIRETRSGYLVKDAQHLAELLPRLYREFKEKGYLPCDSIHTERFSRKTQTQKLAELI